MPELQQKMKDKVLQVRRADASAARPYDDELIPAVAINVTGQGLAAAYYEGTYAYIPDFSYLSALSSANVANIDFAQRTKDENIGFMFTGYLNVPSEGAYTFYTQSSAHYHLKIHDIHLLNSDMNYNDAEQSATLNLKSGYHPVTVYYQQNENQMPDLSLHLSGPALAKAPIEDTMWAQGEEATTAIFNLNAEQNFNMSYLPTMDLLRISAVAPLCNAQAKIYNALGQLVRAIDFTVEAGSYYEISTADFDAGMYVVKVAYGEACNFVEKIVVE